jgi:hypothetical protein
VAALGMALLPDEDYDTFSMTMKLSDSFIRPEGAVRPTVRPGLKPQRPDRCPVTAKQRNINLDDPPKCLRPLDDYYNLYGDP